MKSILLPIMLASIAFSCQPEASDPKVLMEADLAFSKMSETDGIAKAFIHFADTNVVLLRDKTDPIQGKSQLKEVYDENASAGYTLTWAPEFADMAKSEDLGYTWGRYYISAPDSLGNIVRQTGYYMSVWKKQPDGLWKYVLDGGTSPIPAE